MPVQQYRSISHAALLLQQQLHLAAAHCSERKAGSAGNQLLCATACYPLSQVAQVKSSSDCTAPLLFWWAPASTCTTLLARQGVAPADIPGFATLCIPTAGIFVSDILDAVPIDKYFELFKPSAGGEGGFIRLGLNFVKDPSELPRARGEGCRKLLMVVLLLLPGNHGMCLWS